MSECKILYFKKHGVSLNTFKKQVMFLEMQKKHSERDLVFRVFRATFLKESVVSLSMEGLYQCEFKTIDQSFFFYLILGE